MEHPIKTIANLVNDETYIDELERECDLFLKTTRRRMYGFEWNNHNGISEKIVPYKPPKHKRRWFGQVRNKCRNKNTVGNEYEKPLHTEIRNKYSLDKIQILRQMISTLEEHIDFALRKYQKGVSVIWHTKSSRKILDMTASFVVLAQNMKERCERMIEEKVEVKW